MGLYEALKQGVIGFALFAGNWFLPATEDASVTLLSVTDNPGPVLQVSVKIDLAVNPQIEELIDAGVPLNMKFTTITDCLDTIELYRSLSCDVARLTYRFSDSAKSIRARSKEYPIILLALKDFCRWDFSVPREATHCRTEIEILYSHVSRLNRTVDMSRVWGQKRVKAAYPLERPKGKKT